MAVSEVGIRLSVSGDAQVKGALAGAEKSLGNVQSAAADASQSLRNLAGAFAGAVTVGAFIKAADSVTILNNQLKLATGSADAAATAYASLFDIAQRSRVSFTELGGTFATISRAGQELGLSQQRLLGVTEAIGNAMTISGGSAESMKAALVQLGQGLASGTLRGEELNSVMEQTPRLAKALADGLGVSTGKLREMGAAGQITAEQVIKALESQSKVLSGEVQGAVLTVGQAFTQLQNASVVAVGEFDKATGASSALAAAITGVATTVGDLGRAFKENEGAITTTLGVLAGGAAAAGAVALAANFGKVTAAVKALGVVLAANPLTLSLLGIGAVVGGFVAYDQAQRKTEEGIRKTIAALEDLNKAPSIYARDAKGIAEWTKASEGRRQEIAKLRQELAGMGAKQETTAEAARLGRQSEAAAQASNANKKLADSYAEIQTRLSGFKGDHAKYQADLKTIQELREKGVITEKQSVAMLTELAKKHSETGKAAKSHADGYSAAQEAAKGYAHWMEKIIHASAESEAATNNYTKTQKTLLDMFASTSFANMTDEMKRELVAKAEVQIATEQLTESEKHRIKALDEASKATAQYYDALQKELGALEANVEKLKLEGEQIGLSKDGMIKLTLARMDEAIATEEQALAMLNLHSASGEEIKLLERRIALMKQQRSLTASNNTKQTTADAARDAAKEWEKTSDKINDTLTDALMRGFESGKDFAKNMRDTVVNMFKTMVLRPVISAIVNPVAGALTGALGLAGNANASTGGIPSIPGLDNLFGGSGGGMYGSFATSGIGQSLGLAEASWYGAEVGLTSLGQSIGAAMPYIGLATAALSMLAGMDDSGTMHTGGVGGYSAAGGARTGAAAGVRFGVDAKDYTASAQSAATAMAKSVVGLLDSTATTFGKEAGYYAATAFADDTSADGAWGALRVKFGEQVLLDWGDNPSAQGDERVPRVFADGAEGAKQYAAEIAKDVRTLLIAQTPDWADTMLNALGDAPTIEQLANTVGQINMVQAALVGMGDASQAFANMGESVSNALIAALGGAEAAAGRLSGYYANFYSETERQDIARANITETLGAKGVALPGSRTEFRSLVDQYITSGDTETAALLINNSAAYAELTPVIQQNTAAVQAYVPVVDEAAKAAEKLAEKFANARDSLAEAGASLQVELLRAQGDAMGAATLERDQYLAGFADLSAAEQAHLAVMYDQNQAVRDQITAIEKANFVSEQKDGLERRLLEVQGDTAAIRALELAALDESNRPLQERIWALEDERAEADKAAAATERLKSAIDGMVSTAESVADKFLSGDLLKNFRLGRITDKLNQALGQSFTAEQLGSAGIPAIQQAVIDFVQSDAAPEAKEAVIQLGASLIDMKQAALDAADASAKAITDERLGLERQLLGVNGDTVALRALDLAALDSSNRALQGHIWALEDAKVAAEKAAAAERARADQQIGLQLQIANLSGDTAAIRAHELSLLDGDLNKALQKHIWLLEDQKTANEAATAAAEKNAEALRTSTDNAYSALERAVAAQRKTAETQRQAAQDLVQEVTAVFDTLKSNVADLFGEVEDARRFQAAQARAFITAAITGAKAGAGLPDSKELAEAISAARAGLNDTVFASQAESDFQRLVLANELKNLQSLSGDQLTEAERQLKLSEDQLTSLDATLETAKSQLDALRGIDISVISVQAAIDRLGLAMAAEKAGAPAAVQAAATEAASTVAATNQPLTLAEQVAAMSAAGESNKQALQDYLSTYRTQIADYSDAAKASIEVFMAAISKLQGVANVGDVKRQVEFFGSALANVPAFDVGTNYVPRDMIAQIHEGEAIVPKAYNPAANGGEVDNRNNRLESLVEGLTSEVKRLQSIVNDGNTHARRTAETLDNVTEGGSAMRTVAA